jgi:hypothetical protein
MQVITVVITVTAIPVITLAVYTALYFYKKHLAKTERLMQIIPVLAGGLGVVLGIAAFYALPVIIAARTVTEALVIGLASGLAATGANQTFKQLLARAKPVIDAVIKQATESKSIVTSDVEGEGEAGDGQGK